MSSLHVMRRGRGTMFGLILGVFEPDFDVLNATWVGGGGVNVESDTFHRGRVSGL